MRLHRLALWSAVLCPIVATAQSRPTAAAQKAIVSGRYLVGIAALGDTNWFAWSLRVQGDRISGDMSPQAPNSLTGRVWRDSVELVRMWDANTVRARFRAVLRDGRLTGMALGNDRKGVPNDTALFMASLQPVRTGPARTISFEPTTFYRNFSRSIPPALRIFPGDTVETRTVDAGGVDWTGKQRTAGGNPQTGPFYIEGTIPGDVIAIHLHRVRLNRDYADAGTSIVGSAITTGLAQGLPNVENFSGRWALDRAAGVARLQTPTPAMASYTIPFGDDGVHRGGAGAAAVDPHAGLGAVRRQHGLQRAARRNDDLPHREHAGRPALHR